MAKKRTLTCYSFVLLTCNLGSEARSATNPFTGELMEFPIDDGLTEDEIEALQEALEESGIEGPEPDFEGYAVYGDNGECLRLRGAELQQEEPISSFSVELTVKALDDNILEIILQIARAGNLALATAVGPDCVRIVDAEPSKKMLKRWPDATKLSSVEELRDWLENSIQGS